MSVKWPLVRLYVGLVAFGISLALMVRADLGLGPWDVFHQGLARLLDVQLGWVTIGVGLLVLLCWIPLRERPGLGTVSNAVLVGLVVNASLEVIPAAPRVGLLVAGILLNGVATALYLGAAFGAGPRDGLVSGLVRRGHSVRVVRTAIELTVLAAGMALGGTVGIGTVAFALAIGPLTHYLIPRLAGALHDDLRA